MIIIERIIVSRKNSPAQLMLINTEDIIRVEQRLDHPDRRVTACIFARYNNGFQENIIYTSTDFKKLARMISRENNKKLKSQQNGA